MTKTSREFIDYLMRAYGPGGFVTKAFPTHPFRAHPLTLEEAQRAAKALSSDALFNEGDSTDREAARELVIGWRQGRRLSPKGARIRVVLGDLDNAVSESTMRRRFNLLYKMAA